MDSEVLSITHTQESFLWKFGGIRARDGEFHMSWRGALITGIWKRGRKQLEEPKMRRAERKGFKFRMKLTKFFLLQLIEERK